MAKGPTSYMVGLSEEGNIQGGDSAQVISFRMKRDFQNQNIKKSQEVRLKDGPLVIKKATLLSIGAPGSDEVRKTSLVLRSYKKKAKADGGGYDFDNPSASWNLDDTEEIRRLQVLLNEQLPETGTYQALSKDTGRNEAARKILKGELDADLVSALDTTLSENKEARELLTRAPIATMLADAVNIDRQKRALEGLKALVDNPATTEPQLQKFLEEKWWIFGGRYIEKSKRRSLVVLDQMDIPLIRSDGSLHIVELKQANIEKLIKDYRNHRIVGDEVNEAFGQASNYLLGLDEQRAQILADLRVDTRRASVTVVMGHAKYAKGYTPQEVYEALRVFNSHHARIEVITYDELIAGMGNSLGLSD